MSQETIFVVEAHDGCSGPGVYQPVRAYRSREVAEASCSELETVCEIELLSGTVDDAEDFNDDEPALREIDHNHKGA